MPPAGDRPTAFEFHAAEGHSWRLTVDGDGARSARIPAPGISVHGTAGELVLFVYSRIAADSLRIGGDAGLFDLLRAWEPEE
ncbi:hypothetical protein [Streptomyces sp. NPDC004376]